jgi:hypothetical protein
MDQSTLTVLVIAFLSLLAICVTVASIVILSGGKLYHKIPAKSRPRRWVIAIFFSYFVVFCVWFPVWFFYLGIPDDADQCSGACRSPIPG